MAEDRTFDTADAERRHRVLMTEIQEIRDRITKTINDYYDTLPESEEGKRQIRGRIKDELRAARAELDNFIGSF